MALNFDLTKIDNYKDLCWRETAEKDEDGKPLCQLALTTDRIIWSTLSCDMGHLKDDEACEEFYSRYLQASWAGGWTPEFTLADVKAHKGLRVNVSKTSAAKWRGCVATMLRERAERTVRREVKEAAEQAEARERGLESLSGPDGEATAPA